MNCKQESYFPNGMYLMPHLKWLNGKFYAMWFHPNKNKQAAELFSIEWAVESPLKCIFLADLHSRRNVRCLLEEEEMTGVQRHPLGCDRTHLREHSGKPRLCYFVVFLKMQAKHRIFCGTSMPRLDTMFITVSPPSGKHKGEARGISKQMRE